MDQNDKDSTIAPTDEPIPASPTIAPTASETDYVSPTGGTTSPTSVPIDDTNKSKAMTAFLVVFPLLLIAILILLLVLCIRHYKKSREVPPPPPPNTPSDTGDLYIEEDDAMLSKSA